MYLSFQCCRQPDSSVCLTDYWWHSLYLLIIELIGITVTFQQHSFLTWTRTNKILLNIKTKFVLIFLPNIWYCDRKKFPAHYFPLSTNQSAVLLTECWTANQNLTKCCIDRNHREFPIHEFLTPMLTCPTTRITKMSVAWY